MSNDTATFSSFKAVHAPVEIPLNLYRPNGPGKAKVIALRKLTGDSSPNDVEHIVLDYQGSDYWYLDGQSAGILPPGTDESGKPHKLRLYSIASPGIGEGGQDKTLSLCVKRVVYNDPETGEERRGVCSNYLCDLKVGDMVDLTGPTGKAFLLPEIADANMIMIATGTGIAPFRAFLQTRYSKRLSEKGETWLFFGMQHGADFLYQSELESYEQHDSYHLITAISREQKTEAGQRMYVQHRIAEHADAVIDLIQKPNTYVYMCGLRGMETGILEALNAAAEKKGSSWKALHEKLEAEKRWRIEVY